MEKLDELINLITNRLDSPEREKLIADIKSEPDKKKLYSQLKATWALMVSRQPMSEARLEESFQRVKSQIEKPKTLRLLKLNWMKSAAVLALFVGLSAIMFYLGRNTSFIHNEQFVSTIETPNGQISKIILPDSSVVWLNSGTTLKYDNRFSIDNRHLSISGQAYLEVKRNENLPLVVSTDKIDVKVLGTKFDVCAYPDEYRVQVVLKSGRVELLNSETKELLHRLKPGEMASYDINQDELIVENVEPEKYISWKDGDMVFKDTPMAEVIKRLERRYDVVFKVKDDKVYRSVLTGNFRNTSLNDMLKYIQFTSQISFSINNDHKLNSQEIIVNSR